MATVYNLKWSLTVGIILLSVSVTFGQDPITPPPKGPKPVVANGIVYNLVYLHMVPEICRRPYVLEKVNFEFGIVIRKDEKKAIMRSGSPYKMRGNIELEPKSCLWIEPGTVFHVSPGYGFIVNGTLIARVRNQCVISWNDYQVKRIVFLILGRDGIIARVRVSLVGNLCSVCLRRGKGYINRLGTLPL